MRRILQTLALTITILPALLTNVSAQDAMPLSLKDAMDYAVKNNAAAKNARIDVEIQKAQVNQQISAAYPHINAKGEFDDYIDPVKSFIPGEFFGQTGFIPVQFLPKFSSTASVSGSQILFDGGVLIALQARKTVIELARQNGQLTEENLRYNVQKAYYSLVIAHRQFDIIKQSLRSARDIAHDIAALRQSGFAEKIDVDRTDVQVNNLATDSLKVANLLTLSEQLLKYQMGMNIEQPIVLTDTSVEANLSSSVGLTVQNIDYTKRTEYNLLQTTLKAQEYNVKRYKLAAIPTLSAFGNMGYTYQTNNFSEIFKSRYVWSSLVGLQLNVPIFNGFMRTNQVREAKYNVQKTLNNIDNIKLSIDFQSAQAKSTLTNTLLQLNSQRRNLDLANTVLDLANKKYKAGVGSNLEVNQAQTDLLRAQNNYFSSLLDVVNAQADLQKALGLLK